MPGRQRTCIALRQRPVLEPGQWLLWQGQDADDIHPGMTLSRLGPHASLGSVWEGGGGVPTSSFPASALPLHQSPTSPQGGSPQLQQAGFITQTPGLQDCLYLSRRSLSGDWEQNTPTLSPHNGCILSLQPHRSLLDNAGGVRGVGGMGDVGTRVGVLNQQPRSICLSF